jgi:DNA-binding MarR family transcriptional regulator
MAPKRPSSSQTADIDREKCLEIIGTCACFSFRKASRSVTQLFDQTLAPIGLRSTQLTILVAAQVLGPCGLARLARELVMDRSTITRNIHPLVSQEMLQVTGKSGRGGKSVVITKLGQQALLSALPYWKEAQGQLLQRMGKDRLERVMVDLGNVVDAARATA